MYIKAALIPKHVKQLAKSTLFKLIHDKKLKAIILDRQYYIYWPDLRIYLEEQLLVDIEKLISCNLKNIDSLPKVISSTDLCRHLGIDARKWKNLLEEKVDRRGSQVVKRSGKGARKLFEKNQLHNALLDLQKDKQEEYDHILKVIARWQQEYLNNNKFCIFPMPQIASDEVEFPGILIKHLVEE